MEYQNTTMSLQTQKRLILKRIENKFDCDEEKAQEIYLNLLAFGKAIYGQQ